MIKTKNILFFIGYAISKDNNRGVCGPEIRYLEVCKIIGSKQSAINIIVIYPYCGSLFDEFKKLDNKNIINLIAYSPKTKFDYFKILYKVLKKNEVDIIHCQGPHFFDAITVILGKLFSVKTIITRPINISQDHITNLKKIIFYISDQVFIKKADCLVAISQTHKNIWRKELDCRINKKLDKKMKIVYNGIDLYKFNRNNIQKKDNKIIFTIIAQLTPVKGHELLFKAAKMLIDDGYSFQIDIVGDGPLRKKLENFCKENNINKVIRFYGFTKNVNIILSKSDVVILPSLREGLALALLEGLSMGCPLIATDVGASKELVQNNVNGFLIRKNNIKDIYEKMKYFICFPESIITMGNASKKMAYKYDIKKMAKEYLKIYLTV